MGIKLPWFRARMTVKEGQEKNSQLVGTYSYKFDSYFDSNARSKPTPFDSAEGKQNKAKKSTLIDKKLPDSNKNKSAEKPKSKATSVKKISGKESSLEEHKTNKNSNVPEKNTTHTNKGVVKKSKRAVAKDLDQHFASTIAEGVQPNTSNAINNENTSVKTDKEKLLQEAGIISHKFKAESESHVCNESDSENQKNSQIDNENSILLRSNQRPHASNDGTQKSLRERRIPESNLEQLTILIPDSSDEFDEEDIISPVVDEFHAYDEFDS